MMSSTRSRESASRSSRKEASEVTSLSSTPSLSAVISWILANISSRSKPSLLSKPYDKLHLLLVGTQRVVYPQNALLHSHSAIHGYGLTRNVPRALSRQESHDLRHLLRLAKTPHRNPGFDPIFHVLGQGSGQLRLDVPRRHRVDRDPALRHLPCHALGEPDDPRLGGRVVGLPGVPDESDDGGHTHDPAPPGPNHGPESGPRTQVCALEVRLQYVVELVLFHPHHEVVPRDTGGVDQYVHPPEGVAHTFEQRFDIPRRGHVSLEHLALCTGLAHRFGGLLGCCVVRTVGYGHVRTFPCNPHRYRPTDAATAAGYDRHASFLDHLGSPLCAKANISAASHTRSPPTSARPLPRPTVPFRRSIRTSILRTSPGRTCRRNLTPSMPAKSASFSLCSPPAMTPTAPTCAIASIMRTPGMTG